MYSLFYQQIYDTITRIHMVLKISVIWMPKKKYSWWLEPQNLKILGKLNFSQFRWDSSHRHFTILPPEYSSDCSLERGHMWWHGLWIATWKLKRRKGIGLYRDLLAHVDGWTILHYLQSVALSTHSSNALPYSSTFYCQ